MEADKIPEWDLSVIFSGFDDPSWKEMFSSFGRNIKMLNDSLKPEPPSDTAEFTDALAGIIKLYNETGAVYEELFSYAYCRYSTDTSDSVAMAEINRIEKTAVEFTTFQVRFRNYLAAAEKLLRKAIEHNSYLKQFRFFFEEQLKLSSLQMSPEMEELASDLARSGAGAWERLQETLSSSAIAVWDESTGETKTSVELRAMAFDPDEKIRKKAFEKEIALWKSIETPMAFALNGVKGAGNSVNSRRGYASTLERSTLQARIRPETLDSMLSVMTGSLPVFRRYMKLKAGLLGKDRIAFYDLFAPVIPGGRKWKYNEAADFIVEQFTGFSPDLGSFARQAFDCKWIDAKPRQNKVGGAYCTGFHSSGVSRILCNYSGSFSSLSTMAHELGHAYHNYILRDAPEIYRDFPMTLAETASIFCETIVLEGALQNAGIDEQLELLEHELMESTQVIVDILSRFIFEKNVFERRAESELSAADFCELMSDAQKQTYGSTMDENLLHPYMWAVKGHYYRPELGYYNFPYAFGKLFGLGLYSLYRKEGAAFTDKYRKILYMTGNASAEDVTKTAGYDITTEEFWRSSISLIESKAEQFERLCLNRK